MRTLIFGALAAALVCVSSAISCKGAPEEEREHIAAMADATTRQLIAALNARSREALAPLLVITSTTGGAPRALRKEELDRLMTPEPPFEYLGAGRPGVMMLRDAAKVKRSVRLVKIGDAMKVLASTEAVIAGDPTVRVVSIMRAED